MDKYCSELYNNTMKNNKLDTQGKAKLRTRWFQEASTDCPLSEYPRPQMARSDWTCLNGLYDYAITAPDTGFPSAYDGKILVPFSLESELSGVGKALLPEQRLWYRRFFELGPMFNGKRTLLHFGAVDWQCEVYINGKEAGRHTGGYCPFSLDITDFINPGRNELVVRVYDPTDAGWQQRGKQVLRTHGFWYTATSGIWQTVWLEPVDKHHIINIKLLPDIDRSTIRIKTILSASDDCRLKASVLMKNREVFAGEIGFDESVRIDDPCLWSPESPFLYTLKLELFRAGELCDRVESYFGMRKFSTGTDENGVPRLMLNNKPYFQKGLLDQGYWPDGILTPPADEAMVYDIEAAKSMGFNMLRKHIKTEPLRWYYHCDRLGMIVWQDMISGGRYIGNLLAGVLPLTGIRIKDDAYERFSRDKKEWRDDYKRELFEIIDTLFNSVSVACWVPFNEAWGQFDARRIGEEIKEYDPGRIVDHASGWYDQGGPELRSVHRYILRVRKPKDDSRPFVLSEYGGYSLVKENHVWNREKCFGYRMFRNKTALTKAYEKLHNKQVIPLIEKGLSATVYTQLSDVENEVNGLLTYDRDSIKIDTSVVNALNERLTL